MAIAALEEQQRHPLAGNVKSAHFPYHYVVIAGFVDRLELAVDPGDDPVRIRRTRGSSAPGKSAELVLAFRGEGPAYVSCSALSTLTQKDDAPRIRGSSSSPCRADRHERRVKRDTGKRANRHPDRPAVSIDRSNHGDAGGIMPSTWRNRLESNCNTPAFVRMSSLQGRLMRLPPRSAASPCGFAYRLPFNQALAW